MEMSIVIQDKAKENAVEFSIIQSIYEIRGVKVMLDYDLAEKYEVKTKRLKEAVRRNIERFSGDDFMFELTKNEVDELSRTKFATLKKGRGSNIKYPPFAFTELGVAMLSSVLNSEKAIRLNKDIMRAFVALRKYALTYAELKQELDAYTDKTDKKIDDIYKLLDALFSKNKELEKPRTPIGYKQKNIK
jgi:hypothetical protein